MRFVKRTFAPIIFLSVTRIGQGLKVRLRSYPGKYFLSNSGLEDLVGKKSDVLAGTSFLLIREYQKEAGSLNSAALLLAVTLIPQPRVLFSTSPQILLPAGQLLADFLIPEWAF